MKEARKQIPRRLTHERNKKKNPHDSRKFDYSLDYKTLDLRAKPELYRVGVGEQGVLLVEPYKSEILPYWKFATPEKALKSSRQIYTLFKSYKADKDFVGMDMARKFLQMGFTRSRRYANHKSGRKYDSRGNVLDREDDQVKAASAEIFFDAWKKAEADEIYADLKLIWREAFG